MRKTFSESMQLLDEVSKNNKAWYFRDVKVGYFGYTFEIRLEQKKREEEIDQDITHIRTQIDLLMKRLVASSEKANDVEKQSGRSRHRSS